MATSSLGSTDQELEFLRENVQTAKKEVEDKFEQIRKQINTAESEILLELDSIFEEYEKQITRRARNISELETAKSRIYYSLRQNDLIPALDKLIITLDSEQKCFENEIIEIPHILVAWDEVSFEDSIKKLCRINEIRYTGQFLKNKPKWHQSKQGDGPQDLKHPRGLAFDRSSDKLFIADCLNDRIQVYKGDGSFIRSLGEKKVKLPRRICVHEDFLFVTCELSQLLKINKKTGDIVEMFEFDFMLSGLDTFRGKYIYICDLLEMQIVVVRTSNLKVKRNFPLKAAKNSETQVRDIRVTVTEIFVLFHKSHFPLQSFTHEGVLIRHIVTENMVLDAKYFCIDVQKNFLISDSLSHQIRKFSPKGDLIQVVGKKGSRKPGDLSEPQGIAVNNSEEILIVDRKADFSLQAF